MEWVKALMISVLFKSVLANRDLQPHLRFCIRTTERDPIVNRLGLTTNGDAGSRNLDELMINQYGIECSKLLRTIVATSL
jgi:hypothetical protein